MTVCTRYREEDAHEAPECKTCKLYAPQVRMPMVPHGLLHHEPCGSSFLCSKWTDGGRLQPGPFDMYEAVEP